MKFGGTTFSIFFHTQSVFFLYLRTPTHIKIIKSYEQKEGHFLSKIIDRNKDNFVGIMEISEIFYLFYLKHLDVSFL